MGEERIGDHFQVGILVIIKHRFFLVSFCLYILLIFLVLPVTF